MNQLVAVATPNGGVLHVSCARKRFGGDGFPPDDGDHIPVMDDDTWKAGVSGNCPECGRLCLASDGPQ